MAVGAGVSVTVGVSVAVGVTEGVSVGCNVAVLVGVSFGGMGVKVAGKEVNGVGVGKITSPVVVVFGTGKVGTRTICTEAAAVAAVPGIEMGIVGVNDPASASALPVGTGSWILMAGETGAPAATSGVGLIGGAKIIA